MTPSKLVVYLVCAVFALTLIVFAQTGGTSGQTGSMSSQSEQTGAGQATAPGQATEQPQHQMGGAKQPLSPRGQARFSFDDGKTVNVDYGRPYMRNRKIMGGLVPYGKVWRTGANEATSFQTDVPLTIGGTNVPAGKYTLYTLPSENGWELIINKQTGQWGTEYNQGQDLARIPMKVEKLSSPVDQFTISFDKRGPNAGVMKLEWENTSATVDFTEANQ